MRGLTRVWDAVWGRGEFSVTVPSMDGALRPNTRLDDAAVLLEAAGVDDLAVTGGRLYFSQGEHLFVFDGGTEAPRLLKTFSASISAVAASRAGKLAIGLDTGGVLVRPTPECNDETWVELSEKSLSPSALGFAADGSLLVGIGSSRNRASEWKRDLMMLGSSGSVWRVPASGGLAEEVGRDLAFPSGVAVDAAGAVVVSEAWRHRLVRKRSDGTWEPVLWDIPGYPGRLIPTASGGYWLSVFAPRSQMIEFVLREKVYRERMISEVPEDFWMAPSLRAGRSFKEPLQGGGVKHLGIHKPWGPTRSYGLLVRLDENFHPVESLHSRSDGKRHGVTSAADWNGQTIVTSKGDGVLLTLTAKAGQA